MKIAIVGAGFTGLTAAFRLLQKKQEVVVFEKENFVGGLASGFKKEGWEWHLERAYHHLFTNDISALRLAKELNLPVIVRRPNTDVLIDNKVIPFNSPLSLLAFSPLSFADRWRTGLAILYLKLSNNPERFKGKRAVPWIKKWMGEKVFRKIWAPLFRGKFGDYQDNIALTWFWARIKKRTTKLAYPLGGFNNFAQRIVKEIEKLGGKIYLKRKVTKIKKNGRSITLITPHDQSNYDRVIITLPSPIFIKITDNLPKEYLKKISSIKYFHALTLVLILKKPFLKKTYWLNITDQGFPFPVLVEQTNFIEPKYYNHQHIVYIGNYLPPDHPYMQMNANELFKIYHPYLKKINPNYTLSPIRYTLFKAPFAQPIVTVDYEKHIPSIETPIKNVYLANLSMVYPWDRGTNYAIELGERVATLIA